MSDSQGERLPTDRADLRGGLLGERTVHVGHHHVGACLGQGEGHVAAQPAAAAGDHGGLPPGEESRTLIRSPREPGALVRAGEGTARIVDHDFLKVRRGEAHLVEVLSANWLEIKV